MSKFVTVGIALAVSLVAASAAPAKQTVQLPLPKRVLHAGDFLGLRPTRPPHVVHSARTWANTDVPVGGFFDSALLKRSGFAGAIAEHLHWQHRNIDGLSVVVKLGSPAAARKYLSMYRGYPPFFKVARIPGAFGFGSSSDANIVFADGDYTYLVGAGWAPAAPHPLSRAQVVAAAQLLYRRVHHH